MFAVYDEPFWRESGYSGTLIATGGPVSTVVDVSPPSGPAHLCVLANGRDAAALASLTTQQRRLRVLTFLADALGSAALQPARWVEKLWVNDPLAAGGYSAITEPGTIANDPGFQWSPVGRIHWAGTETASTWAGYIEGAISSGERAAEEVADRL